MLQRVEQRTRLRDQARKLVGMLVDREVFELDEVAELLEDEDELKERIKEGEDALQEDQWKIKLIIIWANCLLNIWI